MSGFAGLDAAGVLTVAGGAGSTPLALSYVALDTPEDTYDPNSMIHSIVDQGSDVYRVSLTGDGSARDGVSEGVTLLFDVKDSDGNTIDYTEGKHALLWSIEIDSAAVGDSLLVMPGAVGLISGVPQWVRLLGFSTHTAAVRQSKATVLTSNATTTATDITKIRGYYTPIKRDSGDHYLGGFMGWTIDSGDEIINIANAGGWIEEPPSEVKLGLFLGFDTGHTNTKTADVKVSSVAVQVWP